MPRNFIVYAYLTAIPLNAWAQVPVAGLDKPPADARHFIIESTAGKHGDSWSWVAPDGVRHGRESWNLRGLVTEIDYSGSPGSDGMPATMTVRGVTPSGNAAETLTIADGKASWRSPVDAGTTAYPGPAFYAPQNAPIDIDAWLLERLLASPDKTINLLPGGRAHATKLTSLAIGAAGPHPTTINLWAITGYSTSPYVMSPYLIWSDAQGRYFGEAGWLSWLPEEYAGEQQQLIAAQTAALAALTAGFARSLPRTPAGPVAFVNVRTFDADAVRFRTAQTVVVDGGFIRAVGPASSLRPPRGAQIIDGRGMTLVPGLWDCHLHVGDDYSGVTELSMGVTSARDPGNNDALTIERRERAAAGALLFPHVYPSSMIDGKGPYTASFANVATSEAEAIALIDKAKANGFSAIKFYGTFDSAWLPASIAEAHRLGLHVHGHIPVGMRTLEAINDGYDEITHINWVIMQAMPDSVIASSNGLARFEGPGRYAKDVDLDGPAMKTMVDTMARRHIYNDPTMVAFENIYVPDNGNLSPAYAPFVGTLSPNAERSFRVGGFELPAGVTRADYRASWSRMVELLTRMHKAGIPIVAGTDGSGLEIVRELEIYVAAGFTPAEALAAATIAPARLLGVSSRTGSIKAGKEADLALVEGDPSVNIGALRQTRMVMLAGKLLDADALRTAAGFSGRPH